jgi:flavin reductase (DIM6/NTAB) family NADH-FMN oxidoreductase RutF
MEKGLLILTAFFACMPILLLAQDRKYLAGAVPEVDGKVVFQREFDLSGAQQDAIYERMLDWATARMEQNNNASRIVYSDRAAGSIAAMGQEYIVFSSGALSLDRTIVNYQITIACQPGKCVVEVEKIRYVYQEKERYNAEEWITDEVALNKSKTKIVRGLTKFRTKTIDFVEELFDSAQAALGIAKATPVIAAPVSRFSVPLVGTQDAQQAVSSTPLTGYKQIAPDKIPGNIIKMLSEDWMLITAGTKDKFNMMTASWGGLGVLYGKPVMTCYINPARYTYQLMEQDDTYTLTFYTEAYRDALQYCGTNSGRNTDKVKGSGLSPITTPDGSQAFSEAWLIIECRKLVSQSITPEAISNEAVKEQWAGKQLHKMYIGEIINVWVK